MPSGGAVNLGKTTVNVPGIGMGTLTDTFAVFASTIPIDPGSPGFPVLPYVAISLLDNPPSTATNVDVGIVGSGSLLGYDLRTPIGPITGFGGFVPDANPIHTTVGNLVFTSTVLPTSQGTFVATTVPEPASLILMSAGLLAFATRLRPRLMTGRGQL